MYVKIKLESLNQWYSFRKSIGVYINVMINIPKFHGVSQSYYFCWSFVYENTVGAKNRVADPDGVDLDPDPTFEKQLGLNPYPRN